MRTVSWWCSDLQPRQDSGIHTTCTLLTTQRKLEKLVTMHQDILLEKWRQIALAVTGEPASPVVLASEARMVATATATATISYRFSLIIVPASWPSSPVALQFLLLPIFHFTPHPRLLPQGFLLSLLFLCLLLTPFVKNRRYLTSSCSL